MAAATTKTAPAKTGTKETTTKATATEKKKLDCSSAEYLTVDEALCVQIMHWGPFDHEPATIALLDDFS